jgi:hypothetical protein
MIKGTRYFSFIETNVFTKQVDSTGSLEVLFSIQSELLIDPKRGSVISETNGARKARVSKDAGKGKSGGFRYIYIFLERHEIVYLLLLYGKNDQADLTSDQRKAVAKLVKRIKDGYKR